MKKRATDIVIKEIVTGLSSFELFSLFRDRKHCFFLDSGTVPKSITWIDSMGDDAGKHLPASYRLDGDEFAFIAADEGMPRPTIFSTGPGQTMRTFLRRS